MNSPELRKTILENTYYPYQSFCNFDDKNEEKPRIYEQLQKSAISIQSDGRSKIEISCIRFAFFIGNKQVTYINIFTICFDCQLKIRFDHLKTNNKGSEINSGVVVLEMGIRLSVARYLK